MKFAFQFTCMVTIVLTIAAPSNLVGQDFILFIEDQNFTDANFGLSHHSKIFADIDGNFRDDLAAPFIKEGPSDEVILIKTVSNENGQDYVVSDIGEFSGDSWTMGAGDIDNDNFNDLLTAGNGNGVTIFNSSGYNSELTKTHEGLGNFFAQASNFVDIDNDGWLDLFVCNDDGENFIFMNDKSGNLSKKSNVIDMATVPESDNSGNYSSEWTDIDGDHDLDLYIGKCRINVGSSSDPRRINQLFINNDGVFEESAGPYGLKNGNQTWTTNFGDLDNDGDQDLFMIQHGHPLQLFENIEGLAFINKTNFIDGGELSTFGFQSALVDFNNDGLLDIIIGGAEDYILVNNGDLNFTTLTNPFGINEVYSFALGDINEDGFTDVFASYSGFSVVSTFEDKLFTAIPNENNFFAVTLQGNQSNRSGIGAIVKLYGAWGEQTRIIQSGTGYGVTNSLTARFGIGNETGIDSLVVYWPSGEKDLHAQPDANEHYVLYESSCFKKVAQIEKSDESLKCIGEEIILTIEDPEYESINWSTGETEDAISISNETQIHAILDQDLNCPNATSHISITDNRIKTPDLNVINNPTLCAGDVLQLSNYLTPPLMWNNGSSDSTIEIMSSGEFYSINRNECDTLFSNLLTITVLPDLDGDTIYIPKDTPVEINIPSLDTKWYADENGTSLLATGDNIVFDPENNSTTIYVETEFENIPPIYQGGATSNAVTNISNEVNFPQFFTVNQTSILKSFSFLPSKTGETQFEISEVGGQEVFSENLNLQADINSIIEPNILLEAGDYLLNTDAILNLSSFGTFGPQLKQVPIKIPQVYNPEIGPLANLALTSLEYTTFFDFTFQEESEICQSTISPIHIIVEGTSAAFESQDSEITIFPNPAQSNFVIESDSKMNHIRLLNTSMMLIKEWSPNNHEMTVDISAHISGLYFIEIETSKGTLTKKLIKI